MGTPADTTPTTSLQKAITFHKFYAPRVNQSRSLLRQALITNKMPGVLSAQSDIFIEAPAGYGKTTLVQQFLTYYQHSCIWYQLGTEDNDPVLLLSALLLGLSRELTDFTSPELSLFLEKGQIGRTNLHDCARLLLNDINRCLIRDTFIVFEDIQFISTSLLSNRLLDYIIDAAPPNLHFIVTSSHRLTRRTQDVSEKQPITCLNAADLVFSIEEIIELYATIFAIPLSESDAKALHEVTNGWIMGIILISLPFLTGNKKKRIDRQTVYQKHLFTDQKRNNFIPACFEKELFASVPKELHQPFLTLSFLEEIDTELAQRVTGITNIKDRLETIANHNYFIDQYDNDNTIFRFHHLFQKYLQKLGRKKLNRKIISEIHAQAADYYLQSNLVEKALKALVNGRHYKEMEAVLAKKGMELISTNRTISIQTVLQSIPEKTLSEYSWLPFFHGLLTIASTSDRKESFLKTCQNRFFELQDETGELLTLSEMISYHFTVSKNYHAGAKLLGRAKTLYERNSRMLPPETTIPVIRNLATGYCFFNGKMEDASRYGQLACDLAIRYDRRDDIASSRFLLSYMGLLQGNHRIVKRETERSYKLTGNPLVNMNVRLDLHIMQLCQLSMYGDFNAFLHRKEIIEKRFDKTTITQPRATPYLHIWSAIAMIGAGRASNAIEIIEQGMFVSGKAATNHIISQFLQWRALSYAVAGEKEQALQDISTSIKLRQQSGGQFHLACNETIAGACFTLLGMFNEADQALTSGIANAHHIPSPYVEACGRAYQALLFMTERRSKNTRNTIRTLLQLMKQHGYSYFWGWEPTVMQQILCQAVKLDIEADFARYLAKQRFDITILQDGTPLPLMKIEVLDDFTVGFDEKNLFGPQEFSQTQRELIGLLVSAPKQHVAQELVQLRFWPDSPPEKTRKSFDTLTSRFRKLIETKTSRSVKPYITVGNGYIQLNHTRIDATDFLEYANQGLTFAQQGLWWQAGNSFYNALACWKHYQLSSLFTSDQTIIFLDDLHNLLKKACLTWCAMLAEHNHTAEALAILERIDHHLFLDEDYVTLRYQLYIATNNPLKAHDTLNRYRKKLSTLDYSETEINEIIARLIKDESSLKKHL